MWRKAVLKLVLSSLWLIAMVGACVFSTMAAIAAAFVIHDTMLCLVWLMSAFLAYRACDQVIDSLYQRWLLLRVWRRR